MDKNELDKAIDETIKEIHITESRLKNKYVVVDDKYLGILRKSISTDGGIYWQVKVVYPFIKTVRFDCGCNKIEEFRGFVNERKT